MTQSELTDIQRVRREADLLHDEQAVAQAVRDMAAGITQEMAGSNPLAICVMNGGLMLTGWLTTHLSFPLQLDYAHVTRYRGATRGGELEWVARPRASLKGRTLLLIDDIFDEGITLAALVTACRELGAGKVKTAVLVRKLHARAETGMHPDFVGLTVPDRYVFGCGMDYKNYLRNLPAIYAVRE
ncbi:MAG TPA: hypoxanthine-guanine phosphoribosyltransferase [Gammaproteobacteria bacterium]|jgi:hypoxanthine phosphoribosyltransferase|nr:hypoxanthine-guanine phosphoribosyltransferase [Gammaproteobacteria bacterium]